MQLATLQKIKFPICKKYKGILYKVCIMVLVCNMAFAKTMIHILELICFELLCTNVLVVGKIGKVLFST